MAAHRIYERLLSLYPRDFRLRFAGGMMRAFQQRSPATPSFVFWELLGVIRGAAAEWIAKATTDRAARGRCLPDVMLMRPPGVTREQWFRQIAD